MKHKIDNLCKNVPFSRRTFLKCTGAATGMCLVGRWFGNPSLAIADDKPRVVSVHDSNATNYDYVTGYHWEYVDQDIVNNMMAQGVMFLTGETNLVAAWNALIPYQAGESVAIKFNFNNGGSCTSGNNNLSNPLAETANAIIDGLTSIGVPGNKIWITDPSRQVFYRFRDGIKNPNIQYYYDNRNTIHCGPNYHSVPYVDPNSPAASIATCPAGEKILPSQVIVDANHLINVPKFISHGGYVTLALKNHYGSVLYENYDRGSMHAFFNQGNNAAGCDLEHTNILADINNNPHIRDKTRLVIGEGLFGNAHTNWKDTERWQIFDNDDPNMLFFSTDPVAISSVMTDYIMAERGWQDHQQLHAGEYIGLGVHDHWDSFETKQYSLIDYVHIDLDDPIPVELAVFSAKYVEEKVILSWTTASETNNFGFEIYRKIDNTAAKNEWLCIGFVKGRGTNARPHSYTFIDKDVRAGIYQYRLKQIDTDGKFVFSGLIEVVVALPNAYVLYQNYPNPFNPHTNISFSLPREEHVKLEIFNAHGELIKSLANCRMQSGKHVIYWDGVDRQGQIVASGNYFYKLTTSNFSKTRKMQKIK